MRRKYPIKGFEKLLRILGNIIVKIRGNSNKIYRFYTTKLIPKDVYLLIKVGIPINSLDF